jgi:hypothetical protein
MKFANVDLLVNGGTLVNEPTGKVTCDEEFVVDSQLHNSQSG